MLRPRFTQVAITLSLALALLWSLLACSSVCGVENDPHDAEQTLTAIEEPCLEPVDDCCGCPEISAPDATIQQRETGDRTATLRVVAAFHIRVETEPVSPFRIIDTFDQPPPEIDTQSLFIRHHAIRI